MPVPSPAPVRGPVLLGEDWAVAAEALAGAGWGQDAADAACQAAVWAGLRPGGLLAWARAGAFSRHATDPVDQFAAVSPVLLRWRGARPGRADAAEWDRWSPLFAAAGFAAAEAARLWGTPHRPPERMLEAMASLAAARAGAG